MGYGSYSLAAHQAIVKSRKKATKATIFKQSTCDPSMDPHGLTFRESRDSDAHPESIGVVFALDVSGSMGEIPVALATKTLPAFMETITPILPHAQICFMAFGNAYSDGSPIQVGQFESEAALMDRWLSTIHLEGDGGGLGESYDLAFFIAARHMAMDCWEKRQTKGYLFMTGDEVPFVSTEKDVAKQLLGVNLEADISIADIVIEAQKQFHVFFLFPDPERAAAADFLGTWERLLHEQTIVLEKPEHTAIVCALLIGIQERRLKTAADLDAYLSDANIPADEQASYTKPVLPFLTALSKGHIKPPQQLFRRTDGLEMDG